MKKILLLLLTLTTLWSCERQIDTQSSFPFTVTADYQLDVTINTAYKVSFDITPEQVVSTNVYRVKYRMISGNGSFELANRDEFLEGQSISLKGLEFEAFFNPKSIGEIKVELTFEDQEDEKEVIFLNFTSSNNPFEIEINTVSGNVTVNEAAGFSIRLSNLGEDDAVTYTIKHFISQGKGEIYKVTQTGLQSIELGELIPITEGTTNYEATFIEEGINTITVEVQDSNGQKISKSLDFAVDVIDFNFSATPERNETNLGSDININFLISEISGGNDSYKLSYVIVSGNANIFNNNTQIFAGTNIDVPLSTEFSWIFRPIEQGTTVIRFIARNTSGVEREQTVSLNVRDRDFDFTATRSLASVPIGQSVNISYKITEQGGTAADSYTMIFNSSSNGTLTVNGIVYNAGESINIPTLDFIGTYTPSLTGQHIITSDITAVSNNKTKSKEVDIEVEKSDFDFSVTSNSEVKVGETLDLVFNINELVGDSTFDMKYSITGPDNEITNGGGTVLAQNTDYDVDNTFTWRLKGQNAGKMSIAFTVTNQYGVFKSKEVDIEVRKVEFDFDVSIVGADFDLGTPIEFDFDMSASNSLTYELSFNSNTDGTMIYEDLPVEEDQFVPVVNEDFSVVYNPSLSGNCVINFTIKASNGLTVTKAINFQIIEKPRIAKVKHARVVSGICCGEGNGFFLEFSKKTGTTIVSTTYTVKGLSNSKTFVPALDGSSSATQPIFYSCSGGRGDKITVTITDSSGQVSEAFEGVVE